MMLIDTDVLIDVALNRHPHSETSSQLLDRLEQGPGSGWVSWHSLSNLYYITRREIGRAGARDFIIELTRFVEVAATGTDSIRYAAGLPMSDFEDAMQVAAARACGVQCIVTRNLRDYVRSPISAVTPLQAIQEFI